MRESHTAIIERNVEWDSAIETEPYEVSWASEAIFFIRLLDAEGSQPVHLDVQISPDGIRWCSEGTTLKIDFNTEISFVRLSNFGGWLRLSGHILAAQRSRVIVYLGLKE
jgi:hypothetical protein